MPEKFEFQSYLDTIREEAMLEFSERLDRVLATWNGRDLMDIALKVTIKPLIDVSIGETRIVTSTEQLREFLTIINSNSSMLQKIKAVQHILEKRRNDEDD